jgi:hypothetical protein
MATTGAGARLAGWATSSFQLGGRVEGVPEEGLDSAGLGAYPGNASTGSPRQFFHASVAMGARTGRLTNMWSKTAI